MASSWLELRRKLVDGAASIASPEPNSSCGTGTTTFNSGIPGSLDFDAGGLTDDIKDITDTINDLGSEIMGVLNDIGAWIPPELSGQGSGSDGTSFLVNKPIAVDDVEADQTHAEIKRDSDMICIWGRGNEGQSTFQQTWGDESHFAKTTNGSFTFAAQKSPKENHLEGGQFVVRSAGATIFKVGECLLIEVENKNKITSGAEPVGGTSGAGATASKAKAFSIYITGPAAIHATEDLSISSGGNITIDAGDRLTLRAKTAIDLEAGEAGSEDAPDAAYGGTIDMKASKISQNIATIQTTTGTVYQSVGGESGTIVGNPNAAYGIRAADMEINLSGDMYEKILGRKKTELMVAGLALPQVPGTSLLGTQDAAYIITAETPKPPPTGVPAPTVPPAVPNPGDLTPVLSIQGSFGGLRARITKGDIDLAATVGNVCIGNESGGFSSVVTTLAKDSSKIFAKATTGTYMGGIGRLSIFGGAGVLAEFSAVPSLGEGLALVGPGMAILANEVSLEQSKANKIGVNPVEISLVYGTASTIKIGPAFILINNKTAIKLN